MPQVFRLFIRAAMIVCLSTLTAHSQEAPPPPSPGPPAAPVQGPAPVPLAEVVAQAEALLENLRTLNTELDANQLPTTVTTGLPGLTREIDVRREESATAITQRPALETVRELEAGWQKISDSLAAWERDLTTYATHLSQESARLDKVRETWEQTLASAQRSETPPEILQRIKSVLTAIKQTQDELESQHAQLLTLQSRVAKQQTRVSETLDALKQARDQAVNHLLVRDKPPLWSAEMRLYAGNDVLEDSQTSLVTQYTTLRAYLEQQKGRLVLHAVLCLFLIAALYWARVPVQAWVEEELSLKRVSWIVNRPVATALVLFFLVSGWLYPDAPRLWWALLGVAVLLPTLSILRQPIEPRLFPLLNALVVFYLFDQVRAVISPLSVLSRVLLLGETCGGLLVAAQLSLSAPRAAAPEAQRTTREKTIPIAARFALVIFTIAVIANMFGYVSLAQFLGNATLDSFYLAVILYAVLRTLDGVIVFALRVRPLALLGMVRRHRLLLQHRLYRVAQFVIIGLWVFYTLDLLTLWDPVVERTSRLLTATLVLGSIQLSFGQGLIFAFTVWAAVQSSRFMRFVLEEDVYPRFRLARGVPYVISTMLHYAVLIIGAVLAIAAVGVDMTKFTILAGALGVGLGFGLQNIINNFVSGLIVLFERPVKVGDVIQMDDTTGVVAYIGIRATMIRTLNGADVIVPNGKLISDRVTNWTFSHSQRAIELAVSVAAGVDPQRVVTILTRVAGTHPLVNSDPPPQALLVKFGATALDFELRVWTSRFEEWGKIRSDLAMAIYAAFSEERIVIT